MLLRANAQPERDVRTQRLADKLPFPAKVVKVLDGDTLCVELDVPGQLLPRIEYIRLAAIDAPEMRGPTPLAAAWSRDALARLVSRQVVTIHPTRIWRDPYSRIIARVRTHDTDVGAWLVQHGFAKRRQNTTR